jgi:NAD(P)-dependent dehydrogenase (short-subunit alcohol dehydrogenase family)
MLFVRRRGGLLLVVQSLLLRSPVAVCGLRMAASAAFSSSSSASSSSSSSARIFFLTGATDGIGKHTAGKLASDGHRLLIHGRKEADDPAVISLVESLRERGAADVDYIRAELGDLEQVAALAEAAARLTDRVDVLVNNAGVFDPPQERSASGYDTTWAVNVLAPFKLTRLLLPLLAKGRAPRVVTTSSISQSYALPEGLEEVGLAGGAHSGAHAAYSLSKLGDYLFTVGLAARLRASSSEALAGTKCLTMDPGTVNTKMLLAGWGACGIPVAVADNTYRLAATEEGGKLESGSYSYGGSGSRDAKDPAKVDALWALMEEQTGVSYDGDLSSST